MLGGPITKGLLLTARRVAVSPISLDATYGPAAPVTPGDALLLEDGTSRILLEDGTSKLLLEA